MQFQFPYGNIGDWRERSDGDGRERGDDDWRERSDGDGRERSDGDWRERSDGDGRERSDGDGRERSDGDGRARSDGDERVRSDGDGRERSDGDGRERSDGDGSERSDGDDEREVSGDDDACNDGACGGDGYSLLPQMTNSCASSHHPLLWRLGGGGGGGGGVFVLNGLVHGNCPCCPLTLCGCLRSASHQPWLQHIGTGSPPPALWDGLTWSHQQTCGDGGGGGLHDHGAPMDGYCHPHTRWTTFVCPFWSVQNDPQCWSLSSSSAVCHLNGGYTSALSPPQTPALSPPQTPALSPPQTPALSPPQTPALSPPQTPALSPPQTPALSPPQTPSSQLTPPNRLASSHQPHQSSSRSIQHDLAPPLPTSKALKA